PKRHIKKTYLASTSDYIPEKGLEEMRAGMVMDGEELLPAEVSLFKEGTNSSGPVYKITLCQGKYHQIKRMTALAGGALTSLERISMGNLTLDPELAPGEARELTETEVELIRQGQK
ncbi:MAG: 16S rRNA pseudouridine(516) synthase, partial [Clostridiales bacterium]|nr:16S rRNA pseudouridine(516) synthase [Clostridiales bacterium]